MSTRDMVRPSRDGDQFHYLWGARQCLELLPGTTDLVAVSIEGASVAEDENGRVDAGEELIDVGLYYGAERIDDARLVRYVQLKHSTRRRHEPWTASGLKKTIKGFAKRYEQLVAQFSSDGVAARFRFEFTTNRPIDPKLVEAMADLASGGGTRHPDLHRTLIEYTSLGESEGARFFRAFSADGAEGSLWAQRNLLTQDVRDYLPDADYDAPVQLKELVARKATTEFGSDPSIRRHDVLRALSTSEELLQPAPCLVRNASDTLPRTQEQEILYALLAAESPLVIHADGGVGKSVLAARLTAAMPAGSKAILYDCFGDGLYRNSLHFRHRHHDALVQIANELAASGLCHPLIPSVHADAKQYMRAFLGRLTQAVTLLRARTPEANLCLIIDAADNAEMAAEEVGEPGSFVRDLIRTPLPAGLRLAFTCRTHRRWRLRAPPTVRELELRPFDESESARHLRSVYSSARDVEVVEFAFLSSSNPRVQALALSRGLTLQEMLKQLGPEPTTVERAIGELLEGAVTRLRDQAGADESVQIETMCQALAALRPLVPISVLAQLSGTSESAIRSFALDLGRPLLVKGSSLHFLDEPAETWFRERFQPDVEALTRFTERLRPLAAGSSYAAAALPQLLLQAGKLDELVELALSEEGLPTGSPLERRDVELQRLTFAVKACLQQGRHMAAAKLALRAGGECAGEERQNALIQRNTDLAAALMAPDRIEEIVSRRTFGSGWMGSQHAYNAGLLSGRDEFSAEASSRLRMAFDWLNTWIRRSDEERRNEEMSDADILELTIALLRLRGAHAAASFLREWTPRRCAFNGGRDLARRLIDLGRFDQLDALADAAGNDVWLLLGLAAESRAVGRLLPGAPLARALRLLSDRRVRLPESGAWNANWAVLDAVRSAVEIAMRVLPPERDEWARLLKLYLPPAPPADLTSQFGSGRIPLLRAYALEAALRGQDLTLEDVAPPEVRKQLKESNHYSHSEDTDTFLREVGGQLPWVVLSANIVCGSRPSDLVQAIDAAVQTTSSAASRNYQRPEGLLQNAALEWLRILRDVDGAGETEREAFKTRFSRKEPLWPATLISLCRVAARATGFESMALDWASEAYEALEASREDAESQADSYLRLARAILTVSPTEAGVYFDRAVEIASRIGEENLDRWAGLVNLARAAGQRDNPRPRTAYRLSRAAELTYEYVSRDKHFDWESTAEALTDLCASSALTILSRWRDRKFGSPGRLLPLMVYRAMDQGQLPPRAAVVLGGVEARWDRVADLERLLAKETDPAARVVAARIAYRYMRVQSRDEEKWSELAGLGRTYKLAFPDLDRIIGFQRGQRTETSRQQEYAWPAGKRDHRSPDWSEIFRDVDLADTQALAQAYSAVRTYDPPYEFEAFFRQAFARVKPGREPQMVRAIAAWPNFGTFELRNMLDSLPLPFPKQISFQRAVRDAVLEVCRREPQRVHRYRWGSLLPFEKLFAEGIVADEDVVRAALEGFTARVDTLDASSFFQIVSLLAARVSAEEADEALNFGLDLLEGLLRPEDGDGPWRPELQPPQTVLSALAGFVWAGLGSPVVAERWQWAHVVRSAVEMGWTEFIQALLAWADHGAAGPFVDQRLEFYIWHARQWMVIGLARGALDNAPALRAATPLLQVLAHEEHVIIREFASRALQTLATAGEFDADEAAGLESVNRSSLPVEVYSGWRGQVEEESLDSEEFLDEDEKYYFGIDVGPYWFAPLGRVFGLRQAMIEQRARHMLRERMGWGASSGWQKDARHVRRIFGDQETYHSHGSLPKADDLHAYHGYHTMMFVAAALLKERQVRRRAEETLDEFGEWLSDYLLTRADDLWLADRRDPRLVQEPLGRDGYSDKLWCWSVTAEYLDQQLVTDDGLVVFSGRWSSGERHDDETVSVRSALVSRAGAESLVAALQTAPELGRFSLPRAGEREDVGAGDLKLEGWVTDEHISARLDEGDPWAEGVYYPGPGPAATTIEKMGLAPSPDGRTWNAGAEVLARSETWTRIRGYGREADTDHGWRLSGNEGFLKRLLDHHPESCLILSVGVRRRPAKSGTGQHEFVPYPQPYVRYYLMEDDGVARAL